MPSRTKTLWQSKTFWVNALTFIIASLAILAGSDLVAEYPRVASGLVVAGAIVNVLLRMMTEQPISMTAPTTRGKNWAWLAVLLLPGQAVAQESYGVFPSEPRVLSFEPQVVPVVRNHQAQSQIVTNASYRVSLPNGNAGSGTGISEFALATNAHVVSNRTQPKVTLKDQDGRQFVGACVYANQDCDVALIYVPAGGLNYAPIGQDPQPGEQVTLCGWGGDSVLKQKPGVVLPSTFYMDPTLSIPCLQVSASSVPGDSGGGLFSQSGELVAVNWGSDGHAHAIGASNVVKCATAYEQQYCQGGQCYILPPAQGRRQIFQGPTQQPRALQPVANQPAVQPPVAKAKSCECDPLAAKASADALRAELKGDMDGISKDLAAINATLAVLSKPAEPLKPVFGVKPCECDQAATAKALTAIHLKLEQLAQQPARPDPVKHEPAKPEPATKPTEPPKPNSGAPAYFQIVPRKRTN